MRKDHEAVYEYLKKITPEQQAENFKIWIKALRSGQYKQVKGQLRKTVFGEKRYCCLGVANEVTPMPFLPENKSMYEIHPPTGGVVRVFETLFGLNHTTINHAMNLNDQKVSFTEIANYLEYKRSK